MTTQSELTCVALPAVTSHSEGLCVVFTGSSKESPTADIIWAQAGLTRLSGDRITIVTILAPTAATDTDHQNQNMFTLKDH